MHRYLVTMLNSKRRKKCTGPFQLQEWIDKGVIDQSTRVFDIRNQNWDSAENTIRNSKKKTSVEYFDECEQTLSDVNNIAEQLREYLQNESTKRRERNSDGPFDVVRRESSPNDVRHPKVTSGAAGD